MLDGVTLNSQIISWLLFAVPWLTLLAMKREEILRYLPVGLFAIVTTTIVHDIGIPAGFWVVRQAAFPLNEMLPYFYGLIPVLTMWIFKFTNGHFWSYMLVNAVVDIGFAYYFLARLLPGWGIYSLAEISSFGVWLINLGHALTLYLYQKVQEGALQCSFKRAFSPRSQPAVARKPGSRNKP